MEPGTGGPGTGRLGIASTAGLTCEAGSDSGTLIGAISGPASDLTAHGEAAQPKSEKISSEKNRKNAEFNRSIMFFLENVHIAAPEGVNRTRKPFLAQGGIFTHIRGARINHICVGLDGWLGNDKMPVYESI